MYRNEGRERDAPPGEGEMHRTEDRDESIDNGWAGCDPENGGDGHRPGKRAEGRRR